MRIATWNVEWFNALFDDRGHPLADDERSARRGVTRGVQLDAIATVLRAIDADAVMVIEAPDTNGKRSTVTALERFARAHDLRLTRCVMGFANDTQQEIALMFDPARLMVRHDPLGDATGKKGSPTPPRFDGVFRIDLDIDATEDLVTFSKPPLELACQTADGVAFRLIGAHLKSKAPHGAVGRDAVIRMGIQNRRKQLAQAIWLRARIDTHLDAGDPLIMLGDLNDGPGLDQYEALFGRSSVEIVLGDVGPRGLTDPHAREALLRRLGANPTTARFLLPDEDRYLNALLDYIMVSPDLAPRARRWRIWHPFDDPTCWATPSLRAALIAASDHFPVTLDIDLSPLQTGG
jgi:endonuclease/exonuclease/phosphatase family metal-dependent hydrolase